MKYVYAILMYALGFIFLFDLLEIQNIKAFYGTICFVLGWICIQNGANDEKK